MRLKRLDLTRYGKFTEHSIDFGERKPGQTDLHIVYGPNEAGKSTALAAFLDVLFGIELRSRFNFVHPYNTMRIGASFEFAGGVHEFIRIKRERNGLLDGDGNPVAENIISGQLGGMDRDSYRAMFSLDDDTLEAGGESILASKGDLGQLLFSASTGLAGIGRTLVDLRAEADGFYRFHARAGDLANLKAGLVTLKLERDQIDTAASRYAQYVEERDRAQSQYDEAIARRGTLRSRMDEIQRQVSALPRLTALRTARKQLRPLAELPMAPAGWREALPNLQRDETELSAQSRMIDDEIGRREIELEALVVDQAALDLAGRVDRLGVLHARCLTADKDIPDRLLEAREDDIKIAGILGRIGRTAEADPGRLVIGTSVAGTLRDLIERRSGLEAANESAANELTMARHQLEDAQARLQDVAGENARVGRDNARLSAIAEALASLRDGDHTARRRLAKRSCVALLGELADRLRSLRPWSGEIEQLAALPVPEPDTLEHWKNTHAAARNEYDRLEGEIGRLKAGLLGLESERDAIAGIAGVVTDQEAANVRAAREAAWAAHRRALDTDSADSFEAALRQDDIVMNARLRHEADVAKLHQTSRDLALIDAELRIAEGNLAKAATRLRGILDEIEAAAAKISLNGTTAAQLESWLLRRAQTLETHGVLRRAERDLSEAEADAQAVRERLMKALDSAGARYDATADVDEIRAVAQTTLEREAELKRLTEGVVDRLNDVKMRERNLEAASNNDRVWRTAWLEVCSGCWLGEGGLLPSVATVRETLSALSDLGPALERRAALMDRVEKMRDDQRTFAVEIGDVAPALGLIVDNDAPLDLYRTITDRIRQALSVLTLRDTRTRELEEVRERRRILNEKRAINASRKTEMTEFFNVTSLFDVAGKLSDTERKAALESQAVEATREILDALGLASIEEAEIALDNADRAALEAEHMELKARFDHQDQRTRDLFLAHGKAADQVESVGGDAAVAKIDEKRRTILLEIEDGARRYLKLRAGIAAAEHALRSYRRDHRSSMMARASEAFRTISRDAYSGLASQPDKENEILIALAADGSSKVASELSKGTRFQLYLALRVAGYNEFARSHPPVPFIADDIMETFDDFRAEEAIRLLASMGEVGQVIYLTHHWHLCDIAQRVCPGVRVYEISLD
jgi:uncharacterized protein YhaN